MERAFPHEEKRLRLRARVLLFPSMSEDEKTPNSATDATSSDTPPERNCYITKLYLRAKKFGHALYDEVWQPAGTTSRSTPMEVLTRLWRIVEITVARSLSNNIPIQAAALTYYVLMALAPFVMFVLTIFGIVMNVRGEEAVETMKLRIAETMQLIAPETTEAEHQAAEDHSITNGDDIVATVAPELQEFANNLLDSTMTNSGSAGTIGFVILTVLAIFMIARVEDAYNLMWNIKQGRSWGKRFLVYFLFLVFGGALLAVSASILSVSAAFKRITSITGEFPEWVSILPGGETAFGLMTSFVPTLIAFILMTFAFACLNKYMPKTSVHWRPALIGGAFVSLIFIGSQKLTILYVNKISEFNLIYGNLGIIFILMFMLYLSWIFVLLGGQLSFAVQNAQYLKNLNRDWAELSPRSKQEAFFACLFAIFSTCSRRDVGLTPSELSSELCIPVNHVLECLNVLKVQKLIVSLAEESGGEVRYNTTGTVGKLMVKDLKQRFDNLREPLILGGTPELRAALERFSEAFLACRDETSLESLLSPKKA